MSKPHPKLFIIRTYVWANSAKQALKKSRSIEPDECWLDEDFRKAQQYPTSAMGFIHETEDNDKNTKVSL